MLHIETIDTRIERIDFSDKDTIFDVESAFSGIKVLNNEYNRHMISSIDLGSVQDRDTKHIVHFIDRFGNQHLVYDLSTGCKAAILLGTNPQKRVCLIECGGNALVEIVKHCRNGRALMYTTDDGLPDTELSDTEIDVELDGYLFTSMDRLNHYFDDERYIMEPDMGWEGIEKL